MQSRPGSRSRQHRGGAAGLQPRNVLLAQVKEGIAAALQRAAEELTAEGRGDLPPAEAVADSVEAAMFNLYGGLPPPHVPGQ